MPGFRSLGCTNNEERRNFSKIRFYGEIFAVNFSRAASVEKFMRRLKKAIFEPREEFKSILRTGGKGAAI